MNPTLGIGLKICATIAFAIMVGCIKAMPGIPTGQVVFARSFFALLPIAVYFGWRGTLGSALKTNDISGHLKRTIAGGVAMALWFSALKLLPLPEAMAIGFSAPIITLVLAALVLKETMRIFRWTAAGIGFLGVIIVLWPRLGDLDFSQGAALGALLALLSACCVALAMIQIRQLVATETSQSIIFIFTLATMAGSLFTIPFGWVLPTGLEAALFVGAGLFGGIGQIFLTESYRHADASTIAPFEYVSMVWALIIAYVFFAEVPTPVVLTGASIIITAGLFIIYRERRLGLARGKARRLQSQQN